MPKLKSWRRHDPVYSYVRGRAEGVRPVPGDRDRLNRRLADSLIAPFRRGDSQLSPHFEYSSNPFYRTERFHRGRVVQEYRPLSVTGGIFNLEFSPDGKILSAACERRNILIFDPLTRRVIQNLENAHQDCVNCVRFLDTRTFATCSDDTTVALWDVRNLKNRVRTLNGHSNWVKNIEYSHHDNVLVTSGFDGAIYTWDINQYSESNLEFEKVFYTNGLMRMRLTTDVRKMVISTLHGYLVVVHDLDLANMKKDLAGFKPNMYRLMQTTGKTLEMAVNFTKLFHAKRNRVEIISDFPEGNDAEIISSLRLHPQGWVAVSRNTSSDEASEWCCVHDIHSVETREEDDEEIKNDRPLTWGFLPGRRQDLQDAEADPTAQRFRSGRIEIISTGSREGQDSEGRPVIHIDLSIRRRPEEADINRVGGGAAAAAGEGEEEDEDGAGREDMVDGANFLSANSMAALEIIGELRQRAARSWQPPPDSGPPGEEPPPQNQRNDQRIRARAAEPEAVDEDEEEEGGSVNILGVGPDLPPDQNARSVRNEQGGFLIFNSGSGRRRVLYFGSPAARRAQQDRVPLQGRIHRNIPRLTHSIEESNTGRGYIKEQSFSPCGRFIASPFGFGIRLLGWNEAGSELCDCVPEAPTRLVELGTKIAHTEDVLSSAFSPCHWLLVSGCRAGRIAWHQPFY